MGNRSKRAWVRACLEMDPEVRTGNPDERYQYQSSERRGADIARMQREAALSLLIRKQVRV